MNRITKFAAGLGLALALVLAPTSASAQIAILPKAGSAGFGGDIALGLSDRLSVRGGIGFVPIVLEDIEIDGNTYSADFPDYFATAGIDFKLAGPLRLIGGFMLRSGDFEFDANVDGDIEFNGQTFTESGTFTGTWENSSLAPFAGIGLGSTVGSGFGIFVDAGVVFAGDPEVTGELGGNLAAVVPEADFQAELQRINDEIPAYAQYYPFLQVGFRFGFGN